VCDTGNDVVRRITLDAAGTGGLVKTITAGGLSRSRSDDDAAISSSNQVVDDLERVLQQQGYALDGTDALGFKRGLRAPWGVCLLDSFAYVAAAGSNQIWRLDGTGTVMTPIAGNCHF
jgi:hypothetical protein